MKKRGTYTMGTVIRPEVSKRNQYYISRHRYYELKHYCLQYPEFKKIYNDLCEKIPGGVIRVKSDDSGNIEDKSIEVRQAYLDQMLLIEECSQLTDPVIGAYILKGVTEGLPYTYFRMRENIPCGKDMYYELYRKFFYILDHKKKLA